MVLQKLARDAAHGALGRGQLHEHVAAVAVVVEHGLHPAQLPYHPVEALLQVGLQLLVAGRFLVTARARRPVARAALRRPRAVVGRDRAVVGRGRLFIRQRAVARHGSSSLLASYPCRVSITRSVYTP